MGRGTFEENFPRTSVHRSKKINKFKNKKEDPQDLLIIAPGNKSSIESISVNLYASGNTGAMVIGLKLIKSSFSICNSNGDSFPMLI